MKMFICFGLLFSGVFAFAGSEKLQQAQVCYRLSAAPLVYPKGDHVPSEICLEEISLDPAQRTVSISSSSDQTFFDHLKIDSLIRQTEDMYSFAVSKVVFEEWQSGCGYGETVTLKIAAEADFNGLVQKDQLQVVVEEVKTSDTCHSRPRTTVYQYNLQ